MTDAILSMGEPQHPRGKQPAKDADEGYAADDA